jgi:hypothetical protein
MTRMKFYVWKRRNTANNMMNYYPLSKCYQLQTGIVPVAVHAFFKKKDAIKYIKSIWSDDIIKLYELQTIHVS